MESAFVKGVGWMPIKREEFAASFETPLVTAKVKKMFHLPLHSRVDKGPEKTFQLWFHIAATKVFNPVYQVRV